MALLMRSEIAVSFTVTTEYLFEGTAREIIKASGLTLKALRDYLEEGTELEIEKLSDLTQICGLQDESVEVTDIECTDGSDEE